MSGGSVIRFPVPNDSTSAKGGLLVELDALSLYKLARRARQVGHNALPPRGEPVIPLRAQIPEAGVQVDMHASLSVARPPQVVGITRAHMESKDGRCRSD